MNFINEAAVQKVMQELGFDRLQAERHVKQHQGLVDRRSRERDPFPLGRNNSIDHDAEYAIWAAKNPGLAAEQGYCVNSYVTHTEPCVNRY